MTCFLLYTCVIAYYVSNFRYANGYVYVILIYKGGVT